MQQKPLIHLLPMPTGYYFYETNRNEIVSTSKEAYELLTQVMDENQEDTTAFLETPELKKILALGYLSCNRPEIIEHPMTEHLEDYLDRKINKFTLQVTQDCNLRCKYCTYSVPIEGQQRTHAPRYMTWETASKAIDFMSEHMQDSDDVNIGLYGGEPLLARELIQQVMAYAKERFLGKKLSFSMTTNGTLLSGDIVVFCEQNEVMLTISLDGPQEIHDKNRVMGNGDGSFALILENLQQIHDRFPTYYPKIRYNMVVDPANDADCSNRIFVDYPMFEKNNIQSTLVEDRSLADKFTATAAFNAKNEYNLFLSFLYEAKRISEQEISPLSAGYTNNLKSKAEKMIKLPELPERMAPGGPCLPGVLRTMVDVDGKIFPCERCSEVSPVMAIGTIENGFDIDKAQQLLNVGALTAEQCRNCWAMLHCTCCASQIEDGRGLSVDKKLRNCDAVRNQVAFQLSGFITLHELARRAGNDHNNTVTILGGVS